MHLIELPGVGLNMQPLPDKFGIAITNVDLSKEIDESLFDEIVDVFVKKQVLVFSRSTYRAPTSGCLQPEVWPLRNAV